MKDFIEYGDGTKIILPTYENIRSACKILINGELVAFPTETVYGLGGNAYDDHAVAKIFSYKNRSEINPISVCYSSLESSSDDVIITDSAFLLSKSFLPGPLTLLLQRKQKSRISLLCSAGTDTVGIRISSNPIALKLLSMIPFPLAAPSANKSTKLSPTNIDAVYESLKDNANLTILDGGQCAIGIESTIIDCTNDKPQILRLGAISETEILQKCNLQISKIDKRQNPSDKIKHYATNKKIILNASEAEKDDALLAFGNPIENQCKYILNLSEKGILTEAAANLFKMLHELDKTNAAKICVMPIPNTGIGVAINDRLLKANR